MTPRYGKFESLEHYLQSRARDQDHTLTSLSEDMGYGRSYLNSVASGQFRPSVKRCREIADRFGDDPGVVLTLAGYMEPPPGEAGAADAVARVVATLRPPRQRMALEFVEFLKTREVTGVSALGSDQIHVELPDGRRITLELDGDAAAVDESLLRVTLRAALNATLSREA